MVSSCCPYGWRRITRHFSAAARIMARRVIAWRACRAREILRRHRHISGGAGLSRNGMLRRFMAFSAPLVGTRIVEEWRGSYCITERQNARRRAIGAAINAEMSPRSYVYGISYSSKIARAARGGPFRGEQVAGSGVACCHHIRP